MPPRRRGAATGAAEPTAAALDAQRAHLLYVLDNECAATVIDRLRSLLKTSDAAVQALTLTREFSGYTPRSDTLPTCYHCHETFDPQFNRPNACEVDHEVEEGELYRDDITHDFCGTTGNRISRARACGCELHDHGGDGWVYAEDFCYSGRHEIQPKKRTKVGTTDVGRGRLASGRGLPEC